MAVPTLMCMPYPPDEAFSMETLAGVFYRALARVGGDEHAVHFAYPQLSRGRPRGLPAGFDRLVEFEWRDAAATAALTAYVRAHHIRLVTVFDLQVVHPLVGALRAAGASCVVTYTGTPMATGTGLLFRSYKRLEVALGRANRVDAIVCESRAMGELAVRSRGCPPGMVDVVPTGADVRQFYPATDHAAAAAALHAALGIPGGRRVVLFTGHTHERKGIGYLLDAAVQLIDRRGRDDVRFVFCGDRGTESAEWMARIAGTRAAEFVHFAGYRTDVADIMRGADIGALPTSYWDSMTVSVHQMAATALPIVTTSVGGLPEAVQDGVTGLVCEPASASALADALARLLDDPAGAAAMGRAGRERALAEYSLVTQENRLVDAMGRRLTAARRRAA